MLQALAARTDGQPTESRFSGLDLLLFSGHRYQLGIPGSRPEQIDNTFQGYIDAIHRQSSPVGAAAVARALLMSQVHFAYRRDFSSSSPGELWGDRSLRVLERPGSVTRSSLLFRAEIDASYSGTAYIARPRRSNRLFRLMPNHVSVLLGSNSDPSWDGDVVRIPYDAEIVAYLYHPGRAWTSVDPANVFMPDEVCAWSPEPDPINFWRGSSWVSSVVREIVTDLQATDHQQKFFEHAATPNLVFLMDPMKTAEEVKAFAEVVNTKHAGAMNAYKNMFLGGGSDVKVVGSTLESLNLKDLTGGLENRVAMRSRIPAVVLGAREGLSGSSLNTGNYQAARRLLADGWFAPTVDGLCAALESIVPPPGGSELSYRRDMVLFLQEDEKDAADIASTKAQTIRALVDGGYEPSSVVEAIKTGDMSKLTHTGKLSVQLQEPGSGDIDAEQAAAARNVAEVIQKIYLGVANGVLSADEARLIINQAGANLTGPAPSPLDA